VYALHSYMAELSFVSYPLFDCPDNDANDGAFIKSSRTIGSQDAMDEYLAYGLIPLSVNFRLGEVVDREMPM
jgi:hypothetical protein